MSSAAIHFKMKLILLVSKDEVVANHKEKKKDSDEVRPCFGIVSACKPVITICTSHICRYCKKIKIGEAWDQRTFKPSHFHDALSACRSREQRAF